MRYLIVDAALHGTGIRDYYAGGYIDIDLLGLDDEIVKKINEWVLKYENEHYNSFKNEAVIVQLDEEGKQISTIIKNQLDDVKVDYYSAARLTRERV